MKKPKIALFATGLVMLYAITACRKPAKELTDEPAGARKMAVSSAGAMLPYNWKNVAIGGGGYVTGIVIHPTQSNRMYIRTDVGGAYKWDNQVFTWVPMLESLSTHVDGIALDANAPDRVYLALNDGIYRSENIGQSWTKVLTATYNGNGDMRWTGECLAVDPLTSTTVYAGTRSDGLYRSTNTGSTWAKVASVPNGGANGVRTVVIDPATTVSGRSAIVYVGIPGTGIYRSTDGGATFSALSGAPASPNRMQVVGGKLYVAHSTGVTVWNGSSWKDITPSTGAGKNYCGISIEASDPLKIAVCQRYGTFNNPMYRSSDGGTTWQQMNTTSLPITKTLEAAWWPNSWFSSATSAIIFDPLHHGDLYYTDWFGVWYTSDAWATGSVAWSTRIKGDEETVVLTLAAPPGGVSLYSGVADEFGFKHDDVNNYPTRLYNINEGFSIAFCETQPANIAILGATGNDGTGTILATSSNSGSSWTTRTLPGGVKLGRIAISATDPAKMVYVAGGTGGGVYYSANSGASWTAATGAPTGSVPAIDVWSKDFALVADGAAANTFYIFKGGYLYASTNGGATWTQQNATAIPNRTSYLFVAARPGVAGEVWMSLDGNGLYRTTNGGTTITKVTALTTSTAFAFGAPPSGSTTPAVYSYGTFSGAKGLYRSTDLGANWDRIDNGTQLFPAGVKALAGDRNVFGRIYVGTGGRGVLFGQP
ncbi:hypothetical protein F0L74_22585 [Chitinophaga agrisoli]|uniref:BNR/Asp-box repeat protein n=1 Tax=Chitinophaga agrisoli TaxID=2607653 RepID=A0A5B2VJA9_9BACT|nr:hypothetical protein [Chitinophaga agrisoli]KAA2239004.1 hypothetical protein F0L74_22585 [Chitinophaga agrisoli]